MTETTDTQNNLHCLEPTFPRAFKEWEQRAAYLQALAPSAAGALRLRGNFVRNGFHQHTERAEGLLLPPNHVLRGDNAGAFYFYFIVSKAGLSSAVLSLGSMGRKLSGLLHFPALADKAHVQLQRARPAANVDSDYLCPSPHA